MEIMHSMPFTFYGSEFPCYYCDDGRFYLPLSRVCDAIGIDHSSQCLRIIHDKSINADLVHLCEIGSINSGDGGMSTYIECLCIDQLADWLNSIDAYDYKGAIRALLSLFQQEFPDAVNEMFSDGSIKAFFDNMEDFFK